MTSATASTNAPYLVLCSAEGYVPHAWIVDAESAEVAMEIGRYRYAALDDMTRSEWIEARAIAYADLPEIMFGGARV
jgi:hypothetical protein